MPYGRNQGQGQGHSREVDRQSPTGLIFLHAALPATQPPVSKQCRIRVEIIGTAAVL